MSYEVSQEQLDRWQNERWEKHKVAEIIKQNGFVFKSDGRSGMIYYSNNGQLCEIYVEMSGVPKYDILIFFEDLEWSLPMKQKISVSEKEYIKKELESWLDKKKIKSDLNASQ